MLDSTGEPRSPLFKAAVVNEEEPWCGAGTMAATMPALGVGEQGRAGRVSPLLVLITPEREAFDPTGEPRSPPFKAAVVNEEEPWCGAGTMAAMTIRYCPERSSASGPSPVQVP